MYAITHEGQDFLPSGKAEPTSSGFCFRCGAEYHADGISAGYGVWIVDGQDQKLCYSCCAVLERESMVQHGRAVLYLTKTDGRSYAGNWTNALSFPVKYRNHYRVHNNLSSWLVDYDDVWFIGPDGAVWWGRHQGDNDLLRCKRTKHNPSTF